MALISVSLHIYSGLKLNSYLLLLRLLISRALQINDITHKSNPFLHILQKLFLIQIGTNQR
jgi:hypothetical protein